MLIALLIPLTLVAMVCMWVLLGAAIRERAVPRLEAVVLGAVVMGGPASGAVAVRRTERRFREPGF